MVTRHVLFLSALVSACGLEQPALDNATPKGPDWVPQAADPYLVKGQVFALPGAAVEYFAPSGPPIAGVAATAGTSGVFMSEFPGSTGYRNLVVTASSFGTRMLGVAVQVPKNKDIYYDAQDKSAGGMDFYHLGGMHTVVWRTDLLPQEAKAESNRVMANIDDRTTALVLAMLRNTHNNATNLGAVSVTSTLAAMNVLAQQIERDRGGPSFDLFLQVQRVLAASAGSKQLPPCFLFPDETGVYLNPAFLVAADVDYTGDGLPDGTTGPFETALDKAAAAIALTACEAKDSVTVVFMVDVNPGNRDLNCGPINPFKFATDEEGKTMFIAGGMETDDTTALTKTCPGAKGPGCLTKEEWAGVNAALGSWVPNKMAMRDDGQDGDATAGDGVWTAVVQLPYIPVAAGSLIDRGVRIGYKYTYGFPGQGWGNSEEWPGNHRILELFDVNGDGLIVRYDYFGDETSNKNVANINQALCGSNKNPWPEQAEAGCHSDVHENKIDVDGDCVLDAFAEEGPVVPTCTEGNVPPLVFLASDWPVSTAAPLLTTVVPGSGKNGGGFLVEAHGSGFRPSPGLSIEVNTANDMSVSGNAVGGFLALDPGRLVFTAPPFLTDSANVALLFTGGAVKAPLQYTVEKAVGCSLVFPAVIPDAGAGVGSAKVGEGSVPVLGRLEVESPEFSPELLVEVGISPPCCGDGDVCSKGFQPCGVHPDPRYEAGWYFHPAGVDEKCGFPTGSGLDACAEGVTQFAGTLVPAEGGARYWYAVRYSFDYGLSYDYCDLPGGPGTWGNADGFQVKGAGSMWVE